MTLSAGLEEIVADYTFYLRGTFPGPVYKWAALNPITLSVSCTGTVQTFTEGAYPNAGDTDVQNVDVSDQGTPATMFRPFPITPTLATACPVNSVIVWEEIDDVVSTEMVWDASGHVIPVDFTAH